MFLRELKHNVVLEYGTYAWPRTYVDDSIDTIAYATMIVVNNLDDLSVNLGSMLTWPCRSWRL
jgi:hypothetical protein